METAYELPKRKKFYQADFLTRLGLLIASALFLVFQVVKLIRLFSDAIQYKKANGIAPETFSLLAVTGSLLMVGITAWLFLLFFRQQREISRIRPGNRFLLMDALLALYGLIRAIVQLVLYFQNFEILFLLDVLSLVGGLIAPAVILFLADRSRIPPGDVLLLIVGVGTAGFAVLSFIMVAISIGKDYTVLHALPELACRLAVLFMGIAALRTALKLRADMPLAIPVQEEAKPEKQAKEKEKTRRGIHLPFMDALPGYEDEEPEISLFGDEDEEEAAEAGAPEPPRKPLTVPVPGAAPADGRLRCPDCGKRFPAYLGVCPRCGLAVDAADFTPVQAEPPAEPRRFAVPANGKLSCPDCGMRFPASLGVCPRCGLDVDAFDSPFAPEPVQPAGRQPEAPAPAEEGETAGGYFFLLEDGRLKCPDCGMRFPANLGVCPRCALEVEGYQTEQAEEAPAPEPAEENAQAGGYFFLLEDGRLRCPDCGMRFPANLGVCPRCDLAVEGYAAQGAAEAPAPEPVLEPAPSGRAFTLLEDGRLLCPDCGMRFPANLGACPRCGLAVEGGAPDEALVPAMEPADAERYFTLLEDGRLKCPDCGMRFPANLGLCPRCGLAVDGGAPDGSPAPAGQPAETERYFTLLEDGRLLCPDCGKRFLQTLGACPRCGLGVE